MLQALVSVESARAASRQQTRRQAVASRHPCVRHAGKPAETAPARANGPRQRPKPPQATAHAGQEEGHRQRVLVPGDFRVVEQPPRLVVVLDKVAQRPGVFEGTVQVGLGGNKQTKWLAMPLYRRCHHTD